MFVANAVGLTRPSTVALGLLACHLVRQANVIDPDFKTPGDISSLPAPLMSKQYQTPKNGGFQDKTRLRPGTEYRPSMSKPEVPFPAQCPVPSRAGLGVCPHWLQGASVGFLMWEELSSGLASCPLAFLSSEARGQVPGTGARASCRRCADRNPPQGLRRDEGENQRSVEPSLSVCCAAENRD